MKKLFLLTTVLLFGMTACQKTEMSDATSGNTQITVKAALPAQMAETRAAGDGTTVDRCIMQIYLDGELYGERQVAAVENLSATFSVRLVAGKTFDLVFWADKSGADINTDLHYNTADLANVAFTGDYIGNDDARDAFFGTAQVAAGESQAVNVELKRPFGQLNVKTLDMAEVAAASAALVPSKVKIAFDEVPTGINLLTGELTGAAEAVAYADAAALANNENNAGELSFDYVFAPKAAGEQRLVNFTMSFLNDAGTEVASAYEFSNIPVQRNYRTNVSGNLLTKKADINVEVKPEFDGESEAWDGESTQAVTPVSKEVDGVVREVYTISNPAELAWLAEQVNAGNTNVANKKYVELASDIDLGGHEWTPIGKSGKSFNGIFEGNGHTISNLMIDTPSKSDIGFFGFTQQGEIKNLNFHNASVKGYLDVGVVAGTPYTSKYSNITLTGTIQVEGFSYVGGMFGKNAYANLTDLTINADENSYVKANSVENGINYRTYIGGIVGFMGEGNITVSNVVSNIDVTGTTCDIGGVTGIAHYGNSFVNCSCSGNVTLENAVDEGDQLEIGGIAGVWYNKAGVTVRFSGCSFTGTLTTYLNGEDYSAAVAETNKITGAAYNRNSSDGELIIE